MQNQINNLEQRLESATMRAKIKLAMTDPVKRTPFKKRNEQSIITHPLTTERVKMLVRSDSAKI
jgi:hypothetical protein